MSSSHLPIISYHLKFFPFSHHPIFSLTLFSVSLFLIISFTLLPIISISHFLIISGAWSATYYVDATHGKDSNNGPSPSTPWKTIAKVNVSSFKPGDQILFKRGEVWREQFKKYIGKKSLTERG